MPERVLYLVRHGEAGDHNDGAHLTARGEEQARLTGARLTSVPFVAIHHSPKRRAAQTATIIADSLPGVAPQPDPIVGDYIPSDAVSVDDLPAAYSRFIAGLSLEERTEGPRLARLALDRFASEPDADSVELIVTHNFTIGGFVAAALDAPAWKWMTLDQANCGITIIRYRTALPPALGCFNDTGHLVRLT